MQLKKECIAMLLAGGQGSRLGVLTKNLAKPAVPFGGKYRIIDFTLSNCINSGIDTVGVLTQYQPLVLNGYIGNGQPWDLDRLHGGVSILPPYIRGKAGEWYKGTANAIYQNMHFIEAYDPEYVLILSGDHIYKMDYSEMIDYHKKQKADCTIAVIEVPMDEASRFGIMNVNDDGSIYEFEEKPKNPKSNKASMGVYVFSWKTLREYLSEDERNPQSNNDFGKNIIPEMLAGGLRMYAWKFSGYWKDVGTVESLWEANMELLQDHPELNLHDSSWKILSRNPNQPPHYVGDEAKIRTSFISEGCRIYGTVENSVLFPEVTISAGAHVRDSIIMQNTVVGEDCEIIRTIIDEDVVVESDCRIGGEEKITVIGQGAHIGAQLVIEQGMSVQPDCDYINDVCETGNEVSL